MTQEQINRINELARKSKTPEGLTPEEAAEQAVQRRVPENGGGKAGKAQGNHAQSGPKNALFHCISLLSCKKISSMGSPKKSEMVKANSKDGL